MAEQKKKSQRLFEDFVPEQAYQHARAAHAELRASFESLLPPGLVEHRRAARREMLLAARSFIDAALERMEKK